MTGLSDGAIFIENDPPNLPMNRLGSGARRDTIDAAFCRRLVILTQIQHHDCYQLMSIQYLEWRLRCMLNLHGEN